ncbi:MAG: M28 family peptidase [Clostridia bacterium]|nr:M28 family peptidase [Clostridia bacterium]
MKLKERLLTCVAVPGISARENSIAEYLLQELRSMNVSAHLDANGNVHGRIESRDKDAKTVLLEAHMDQIGLMISGIDESGLLEFVNLGGVDERTLCGMEVTVLGKNPLYGIIGAVRNTASKGEKPKNPKIEELFIDVGLDRETAQAQVKVGDAVSIYAPPRELLGDKISGTAMDNRAGVTAILNCLERLTGKLLPYHLEILFSTGEELGLQGAYTGVVPGMADMAIAVDVTFGATPDTKEETGVFPLGCGAVIARGPSLHDTYTRQLMKLANQKQILYEIEPIPGSSGTTAWAIQTVGRGIPTALVSIPLRYMHTNVETLAVKDVQAVSDLLYEAVTGGIQFAE